MLLILFNIVSCIFRMVQRQSNRANRPLKQLWRSISYAYVFWRLSKIFNCVFIMDVLLLDWQLFWDCLKTFLFFCWRSLLLVTNSQLFPFSSWISKYYDFLRNLITFLMQNVKDETRMTKYILSLLLVELIICLVPQSLSKAIPEEELVFLQTQCMLMDPVDGSPVSSQFHYGQCVISTLIFLVQQ